MYHYCITLFFVLLALSSSEAQRLYNNTNSLGVLSVGVGNSNCLSLGAVFLTNSTSGCLADSDANGNITYSFCPAAVQGSTALYCFPNNICFATNPTTVPPSIVALNLNGSGAALQVFGNTAPNIMVNPVAVSGVINGTNYNIYVQDINGTSTNIWNFLWSTTSGLISTKRVLQLPGLIAGFAGSNTTIVTSSLHGTFVKKYSQSTGALTGNFTNTVFGSVESVSLDWYGRVHIYDLNCLCFMVFDTNGNYLYSLNHSLVPISVSHTRDAHLVVDSLGVRSLLEVPKFVNITFTNSTCSTRGSSATWSIAGGAPPYSYYTFPYLSKATTGTYSTSISYSGIPVVNPSNYTSYLIGDDLNPLWTQSFSQGVSWNYQVTNSSGITPHSGTYCFGGQLNQSTHFAWKYFDIIDPILYAGMEIWVNPGLGGQSMNIDLGSGAIAYIRAGDLPNNTWSRVYLDISRLGTAAKYTQLTISDQTGQPNISLCNPMYFDDINFIPYDPPGVRRFQATDFCGRSVWAPNMNVTDANVMAVNISMTPTQCNAGRAQDYNLSSTGVVAAAVSYGTAPYTYSWSFSNTNQSYVANLPQQYANTIVYDNALNSTFTDLSSPSATPNPYDTTYYHSAPYSYSFQPSQMNDAMLWNIGGTFNSTLYSAMEFWVHGGPIGGQIIEIGLAKGTASSAMPQLALTRVIGIAVLPPNQWIKVTYPITITSGFTGILFLGLYPGLQQRIYFDDLVFISKLLTVTVTDSTNCAVTNSYIQVTSPDLISSSIVTNNVKCFGGSDGSAYAVVKGGTTPYNLTWSDPRFNGTVGTGLTPNNYVALVGDSHKCTAPSISTYIVQPQALQIDYAITPIQCSGKSALITATAIGGTPPYTFTWTTTNTNASTYNFVAQPPTLGAFTDTFLNGFNLTGSLNSTTVCGGGTDLPLSFSPYYTPARSGYCSIVSFPASSGAAILDLGCSNCIDTSQYAGVQLYMSVGNKSDISGFTIALLRGNFIVSQPMSLANYSQNATNWNWQKIYYDFGSALLGIVDSILISSPNALTRIALFDDVVFIPRVTATSTTVVGTNVLSGYKSIISAAAAEYTLTVTDGNSCQNVQTFEITSPDVLAVDTTSDPQGHASANVTGGIPPYTYYWLDLNISSYSVSGLHSGSYTVMVTDAAGCNVNRTVIIIRAAAADSKVQVPLVAGSVVGAVALVALIGGTVYYRTSRKQKEIVQSLLAAEEGERRAYKIDFSELTIGEPIGAGSFGEVFKGDYKGTDVAVKKLRSQAMTKKQRDEFAKEAAVMVGLRNPNILLFMGVCLEPENLCIVTEMMPRGDLSELLRNPDISLPIQLVYKMAHDTLKGLQFIHSSGFIHRDLKSPNLLVDRSWNIKIADFGLSCARHASDDEAQVSLLWTAPEILNRAPECYSFASDIYSFGVIMWELITKQIPWEGVPPGKITARVVAGHRPMIPSDCEPAVAKLISCCWTENARSRPTVKEARAILEANVASLSSSLDFGGSTNFSGVSGPSRKMKGKGGDGSSSVLLAPPPAPPFALVVARIQHSTLLWEKDPRSMSQAIEAMTKVLRKKCAKTSGYEISSMSTFVYAFANACNAVNFCLRSQEALLNLDWPAGILEFEEAKAERKDGVLLRRGLRIRMGIHWASPVISRDQTSGRAQYVGPSLAVGASIPLHATAGTLVIDQDIYNIIMVPQSTLDIDPFSIASMGMQECNGTPLNLFKLVPASLKELLDEIETLGDVEEDEPWLVQYTDIKFGAMLGSGSFGDVYAGSLKGTPVAVKKFARKKITTQVHLEMRTECAILRSLNHPNVLKFVGMCLDPPNLCLLTELMDRGSLMNVLYGTAELTWKVKCNFALDIAKGMKYLHKNQIIHRDIKSSNLLVGADWSIRIADFGFSRIKAVNQTMTQCGTVAWTAPEIFEDSHYSEKADVYSYGIVLWEIIFRTKPWAGKHQMRIIAAAQSGDRPSLANMPQDTPPVISQLMTQCWDQDLHKRPTFDHVVAMLEKL